tara:strand:+ start:502 stop:1689 length:1188 start_codon:yes stop_codon:yes gene_type:complete
MLIIDLSCLNSTYGGGLRSFSLDLASAISFDTEKKLKTIILGSKQLKDSIKDYPELVNLEWFEYDERLYKIFLKSLSLVSIISYFLKNPFLLVVMKKVFGKILFRRIQPGSIILSTNSTLSFYKNKCKTILCIHDIQHEIYPENFSLKNYALRYWRYRVSLKLSDFIQVSSKAIHSDLKKYIPNCLNKVFLAEEGFNDMKFNPTCSDSIPKIIERQNIKNFIFYPAQFWKHKNHINLIRALNLLENNNINIPYLVCSGKDYGTLSDCIKLTKKLKVKFLFVGFLTKKELIWCYRNSLSTISSSYHESSCLTLKEAVACGVKSIAFSDIKANEDLTFLPNAFKFDPFDEKSISKAILKIAKLNDFTLFEDGFNLIKKFTWKEIYKKRYSLYTKIKN